MANADDYEAQLFVEVAHSNARLAAYRLSKMEQMADALTRIVAYEGLANEAGTREEAIGHFETMEGATQEFQELQEAEAEFYAELLDDQLLRMERAKAILDGDLNPGDRRMV